MRSVTCGLYRPQIHRTQRMANTKKKWIRRTQNMAHTLRGIDHRNFEFSTSERSELMYINPPSPIALCIFTPPAANISDLCRIPTLTGALLAGNVTALVSRAVHVLIAGNDAWRVSHIIEQQPRDVQLLGMLKNHK